VTLKLMEEKFWSLKRQPTHDIFSKIYTSCVFNFFCFFKIILLSFDLPLFTKYLFCLHLRACDDTKIILSDAIFENVLEDIHINV
jgi:hypothetical protein